VTPPRTVHHQQTHRRRPASIDGPRSRHLTSYRLGQLCAQHRTFRTDSRRSLVRINHVPHSQTRLLGHQDSGKANKREYLSQYTPPCMLYLRCFQNYIKSNAREHERFRKICVSFAQSLHRVDMRLKLGLLQDPAAIERQIQRELKEAEAKRQKAAAPTVKTEAQTKAEEEELKKLKKEVGEHVKAAIKPPRIRPLSEAKAIESGANFISETFLFIVAGGLILFESLRRDRKEKGKDADVMERLEELQKQREEDKEKIELLESELNSLLATKPFAKKATPKPSSKAPKTPPNSSVAIQAKEETDAVKTSSQPEPPAATETQAAVTQKPTGLKQAEPQPTESKPEESSWTNWLPASLFGNKKDP
jgi:hypothetical protein